MDNSAKLTKYVKASGCAAKLGPGDLSKLLLNLGSDDERVLVGIGSNDDAAVIRLQNELAVVQTVDIITPVVDDPFVYGQTAAANSLSDVFAMGAEALSALNIVGFDNCHLTPEILAEILAGGADKVKEAGGTVVGGHTIETPEMLYGLSVNGLIHPDRLIRNDTPRVGDLLILTKPLGMGMITTGIKADLLDDATIREAAAIFTRLNLYAARAMRDFDVSAATDVTGFGLAGHAYEMSGKGRVTLQFDYKALPVMPQALEMASMGIIPAGTYTNEGYLNDKTEWRIKGVERMLFYDAQTSGGLLIAVHADDAPRLLQRIRDEGDEYAAIIGEVLPFEKKPLVVE
ncbi:selenide, water dikinase SelD [Hydrogenimonas sp. SS33]|uniref:selenide, water dikinase SelD n=1 Tax=Hydrogenimonas leucolamina TaxID=2954236 RepID=UPI00336C1F36